MFETAVYGDIEENEDWFFIVKRNDTTPMIQFPFKGIWVNVGSKDNKMLLHSLAYPKSQYSKEEVKAIAEMTTDCPLCRRGINVSVIDDEGFKKYVGLNKDEEVIPLSEKNPVSNFISRLGEDFKTKETSTPEDLCIEFAEEALGAGVSGLLGWIFDNVTKDMIVSKVLKGGVGITGLLISYLPKDKDGSNLLPRGVRTSAKIAGWSSLVAAFDPRPEEVDRMRLEVSRISSAFKRAANLGASDVVNVIKDMFRVPQLRSNLAPEVAFRTINPESNVSAVQSTKGFKRVEFR